MHTLFSSVSDSVIPALTLLGNSNYLGYILPIFDKYKSTHVYIAEGKVNNHPYQEILQRTAQNCG